MNLLAFRSWLLMFCLLLLLLSFAALLWLTWQRFRRGKVEGGNFHQSLLAEMSWVSVPGLIVLGLLWPISRGFLGH